MQYITCDACKKMIEKLVKERGYHTVRDKHFCRACKVIFDRDFQDWAESEGAHYDFATKRAQYIQAVEKKCAKTNTKG